MYTCFYMVKGVCLLFFHQRRHCHKLSPHQKSCRLIKHPHMSTSILSSDLGGRFWHFVLHYPAFLKCFWMRGREAPAYSGQRGIWAKSNSCILFWRVLVNSNIGHMLLLYVVECYTQCTTMVKLYGHTNKVSS